MIGFPNFIIPQSLSLQGLFPQNPIYQHYSSAPQPYVRPSDTGINPFTPQALFLPLKFVFRQGQAAVAVANAGHLISIVISDIASYTHTMSEKGNPYGRSVVDTEGYTDSLTWN